MRHTPAGDLLERWLELMLQKRSEVPLAGPVVAKSGESVPPPFYSVYDVLNGEAGLRSGRESATPRAVLERLECPQKLDGEEDVGRCHLLGRYLLPVDIRVNRASMLLLRHDGAGDTPYSVLP